MQLDSARLADLGREYPPVSRGKVVVWGYLAAYPIGGMTWQVLHHLVGLRRMGFDVYYVEDSDEYVLSPDDNWATLDYRPNLDYLAKCMEAIGLEDRWIYRPPVEAEVCFGSDMAGLHRLYEDADAVFNLCGAQEILPHHAAIKRLVQLQTDPVWPQILVTKNDPATIEEMDAHHFHFTYGENLGADDCSVPTDRYEWRPTRPPVVIDWWDSDNKLETSTSLTTIANWQHTVKDIEWEGRTYKWSKHEQFETFVDLPQRAALPLELALGNVSTEDRDRLTQRGWNVIKSTDISEPAAYRDYIRKSLGEFTVAKEQYVVTRSGWFSDRSVCYLAAGRPVITQETGFSKYIPVGEGLFSFSTEDEALIAIDAVATNYELHSKAAREIAAEYFDAERVLGKIVDEVGL